MVLLILMIVYPKHPYYLYLFHASRLQSGELLAPIRINSVPNDFRTRLPMQEALLPSPPSTGVARVQRRSRLPCAPASSTIMAARCCRGGHTAPLRLGMKAHRAGSVSQPQCHHEATWPDCLHFTMRRCTPSHAPMPHAVTLNRLLWCTAPHPLPLVAQWNTR